MDPRSLLSRRRPKWCTCRPTIPGLSTGRPSQLGRDGTRILESGLTGRTSRLESALESAFGGDGAGAGAIGDATGIITGPLTTTAGTIRKAGPFTTVMFITGAGTAVRALPAGMQGTGRQEATAHTATSITARAERPSPSRGTKAPREVTLRHAGRATPGRELSTATTTAVNPGATRPAEAPAWAEAFMAAGLRTVAEADRITNREIASSLRDSEE